MNFQISRGGGILAGGGKSQGAPPLYKTLTYLTFFPLCGSVCQ